MLWNCFTIVLNPISVIVTCAKVFCKEKEYDYATPEELRPLIRA